MSQEGITIPKSWRSEWPLFFVFVLTAVGSIFLSAYLPWSVITGELFRFSRDSIVYLRLPLFWLPPLCVGLLIIYRVFNVRFTLGPVSVEARYGVLSLRQSVSKVRYEDIRSLETSQSVIARLLGYGDVEIGTSGTSGVEVALLGVLAPREVLELVQLERDRRQSRRDPGVQANFEKEGLARASNGQG